MSALSLWLKVYVMFALWSISALLVWFVALYSHVSVFNSVLIMLFLCTTLQLAAHNLTQSISSLFQRRRWGGTALSITLIILPLLSLPLSPPLIRFCLLPAFSSYVLLPRSPSHHLLSHSLNDLIPPVLLHLSSRIVIEFLCGSYPQGVDVTALILAGVNMSWLAPLLCDSWILLIFWMYNARKTTLVWLSFMIHSNKLHLIASTVENTFPWWLQTLRPLCNVNTAGNWP